MDTSKEYIAMCIAAEEIQTKYSEGYHPLDTVHIPYEFYHKTIEGFEDRKDETNYACQIEMTGRVIDGRFHLTLVKNFWLPRQDQLQEIMARGERFSVNITPVVQINRMSALIKEYSKQFRLNPLTWVPNTHEQFWLVLVMKCSFRRGWDNENKQWI